MNLVNKFLETKSELAKVKKLMIFFLMNFQIIIIMQDYYMNYLSYVLSED